MNPTFDVVTRYKADGSVQHNYVTLEEIEELIPEDDDYDVITRRQYTEVNDKLGNRIFFGDVVDRKGLRGVVKFEAGSFIMDHRGHCTSNLSAWRQGELLVVGNIYDNPELMS